MPYAIPSDNEETSPVVVKQSALQREQQKISEEEKTPSIFNDMEESDCKNKQFDATGGTSGMDLKFEED